MSEICECEFDRVPEVGAPLSETFMSHPPYKMYKDYEPPNRLIRRESWIGWLTILARDGWLATMDYPIVDYFSQVKCWGRGEEIVRNEAQSSQAADTAQITDNYIFFQEPVEYRRPQL
ncbi:MAG: hypothetical protein COA37_00385 [Hoeflea sp.]|nr:MAG: hypothetical protein COA37_00385 [Hoeflea sp.]